MSDDVPVVLVVDIDPDTHLASEGALPEAECVVMGARTAEMALKMAERRPPAVLVVDARLGGIGYLTERLKRLSPHLHIVHLVAPDHVVDPSQKQPGGASLLRKPFEAARFRSTLRTVLRLSAMSAGVKRMHDGSSGARRGSWLGEVPPAARPAEGEGRAAMPPRPPRDGEPAPPPRPRRESGVREMPAPHTEGEPARPTPVPRAERESEAPRGTPVPRAPRAK